MQEQKYLSCILFKNEKGLLGKVATKLGENDVNIEKISISTVNKESTIQKVIVYTTGVKSEQVLSNVIKTMPGVLDAFTFDGTENIIEEEICIIKIQNTNPAIVKVVNLINGMNGKILHIDNSQTIYEIVGDTSKMDNMIQSIFDFTPDVEISRSPIITAIDN